MEALGINLWGIIAYIVNFVILVVALRMLLFTPVKNILAQRQQRIADGLEAADKAAQEADLQRQQFEKDLAGAKQSSQEEAKKVAAATEKMRQDILAAAQTEAEEIKVKAKDEAEQERQLVVADLQKHAAELAMQITQKVVGQAVDEKAQRKLVDQFLTELGDA